MALAPLRAVRPALVPRDHDAGGLGRGLPGRAVARHPRQRDPVHLRRRGEDRERDPEDPGRASATTRVEPHPVVVSAHTNRVPVVDGHTDDGVGRARREAELAADLRAAFDGFAGAPQRARAAARAPAAARSTSTQPNRPQPRLDADRGRGMTVSVGRLRPCPVLDWKFVALGHNTVRGAAGRRDAERRADAGRRPGSTEEARRDRHEVRRHVGPGRGRGAPPVGSSRREHAAAAGRRLGAVQRDGRAAQLARLAERREAGGGARSRARAPAAPQELATVVGCRRAPRRRCWRRSTRVRGARAIVRALAVVGEVSPRSQDAIAAAGELVSSRIVAAALEDAGVPARWRRRARSSWSRTTHHGAALADRDGDGRSGSRDRPPHLEAGPCRCSAGFVGASRRGPDDDARARRLGLLGRARRRRVSRARGDPDLDRRRRHADGGPARRRVAARRRAAELRRGLRAGLLRGEGAAPEHDPARRRRDIPVRILNSQRPEATGTLDHARSAADGRGAAAIACKRGVTRIDITSTRMLMAYGFLRRVFEVFERFRTPVDVVTTSEVSVSVTIDDRRALDADRARASAFADVTVRGAMAIVCAVGEALRSDRGRDAACSARSRACRSRWSRRAARARTSRSCCGTRDVAVGDAAAAPRASSNRAHSGERRRSHRRAKRCACCSSDTAGWGGWSSRSPAATASRSPACSTARRTDGRRRRPRERCRGVDVAIEFTTRRCRRSKRPAARRPASTLVVGTTGWRAHEAELREAVARRGHRRRGRRELLARREHVGRSPRAPASLLAARRQLRRLDPRAAPRGEEGRAVGHRAHAQAAPRARRLRRARSTSSSTRAGCDSRHAHHRLRRRRPRRSTLDARGPRPRDVRARRARGGALGAAAARAGSR